MLHVDDDNFVAKAIGQLGNGINAEKGPKYFPNRAQPGLNPALIGTVSVVCHSKLKAASIVMHPVYD